METKDKKTIMNNLSTEIKKLEDGKFNFMFFVIDTKGTPNGQLAYIYETALTLKEMGYSVKMLHGESEFVGVSSWLGEKYGELPHFNIETDGVAISPSDFLFIPEIYANVMHKTFEKKLPCKRIVLLTNFNYLTEIIQPGATWRDYGINDCVTTTNVLSDRVKELFPSLNVDIVKPCITDEFKNTINSKKLIINVVAENKSDVNKVVKEFFLKYPMYKWVGFRDVRGISHEEFANALNEAFATVWVDEKTDFGFSPIEAMACGNIVIGKIPENAPEWVMDGDKINDNAVWFYNLRDVHEIIANVVQAFLHDAIPNELYENAKKTVAEYSTENFKNNVKNVYIEKFVNERLKDFKEALALLKKEEE